MCQNDRESYFSGDQEAAVGLLPLRGLGATEGPEENSNRLSVQVRTILLATKHGFLEQYIWVWMNKKTMQIKSNWTALETKRRRFPN